MKIRRIKQIFQIIKQKSQ